LHAPPDFRCVHRSKAKLQRFFRRSALGTDADRRYIYISLGCRDRGRFTFNSAAQTADSLLILGWWTRWVSLGSAILLAMFGTAMAISLGLKSPMDYSVYSASAAAVLLALLAFNQHGKTLSA